jgi:hypothetical protein
MSRNIFENVDSLVDKANDFGVEVAAEQLVVSALPNKSLRISAVPVVPRHSADRRDAIALVEIRGSADRQSKPSSLKDGVFLLSKRGEQSVLSDSAGNAVAVGRTHRAPGGFGPLQDVVIVIGDWKVCIYWDDDPDGGSPFDQKKCWCLCFP